MPRNIGSKVEFQNLLSQRMATNSKGSMNYSCLIFSLPAISNNLIFFFCTDPCAAVCVNGSHRANNGKQRTRLPEDLSFIKTSSHKGHIRLKLVIIIPFTKTSSRKGHIRLKLVIIMIRLKSAKLQTPIKFFLSELAC